MVEYHGWITVRPPAHEVDDDGLASVAAMVRREIERRNAPHRILGMKIVNANCMVWFAGCTNHWATDVDDAFEFLKVVAANAPGSYGILYLWDDEDPKHENDFRVWRLAKGALSEHTDPFLSPCIPVIEGDD